MIKNYAIVDGSGNVVNVQRVQEGSGFAPAPGLTMVEAGDLYNVGTASVTNGSKTVTVASAALVTAEIVPGRTVYLGDSDTRHVVASITDETHFELVSNYDGSTNGTSVYFINPMSNGDVITL